MSMINTGDILETIEMFTQDNLDVRTVTMGISLLDCIDPDPKKACEKVYNKITTKAANLVPAVEHISAEYGIPIINKRISVTPIAMLLGACPDADPVDFAKALDAAGKKVGVNFVGGYTALVHKGFSAGDKRLIESIPRALAETDIVCSSVNIGATKAGLNMDAIKLMGEAVKKASELTADRQCIGAAKLVVFCNAPEDNPFMAGAFHGPGEPDCEIHVGVSGPGAVRAALARLPKDAPIDQVAELVKRTAFKITRVGQLVANLASQALGVPAGIIDLSLAPTPAVGDSVANILEEMGLETCGCCGTTACLALLNDAVKKGGVMASNHVGGLSGAFIPVSEDDGMNAQILPLGFDDFLDLFGSNDGIARREYAVDRTKFLTAALGIFAHATFAYDDADAGRFDEFILEFLHTHGCGRADGDHFISPVIMRSNDRSGMENGLVSDIDRDLPSFFDDAAMSHVTTGGEIPGEIHNVSDMNIFQIFSGNRSNQDFFIFFHDDSHDSLPSLFLFIYEMAMGIGGKVQVFIENDMTAAMAPAAYIQRTADDGWMACRILDMDTHDRVVPAHALRSKAECIDAIF